MAKGRIACTECRHYTEVVYTGPGVVTEGKCNHADTLHPTTPGWNSCHLAKRHLGRYISVTMPDGSAAKMDLMAYRQL